MRSDSEGISVSLNAKTGLTGGSASLGYCESEADSSSLHYVNTHLVAGALTVQSLQDEAHSKSRSYGLNIGFGFGAGTNESGGLTTAMTSGSGGLDFLRSDSERRWVAEQSGIIGHDSLVVSARDTVLTGGLLANARRDDSGRLIDQGGLDFRTDTLEIHHLQDVDRSKTVGANVGVSVALTPTNPGQGTTGNQPLTPAQLAAAQANQKPTPETPRGTVTLGGTYFGHVTEQLTQATLGGGRVTVGGQRLGDGSESTVTAAALGLGALNRDLSQAQLITTDEDIGGLNFVATLDLRWATPEGRADLLKEQKQAANGLFLTAMELGVSAKAAASVATDEDIALGDLWTVVKGSVAALHGTSGFVINNPAAAAQIEAQRQGENQDLEALQAATDSYTKVAGDDSSKIFATSDLAGARDATTGTIYLSSLLQSNFVEVAGHEMSHGYTKSESYADFMGWATGLVWSSSVWANSADIAAYRPDYSNAGELQERNAVLLSRNNAEYAAALADHASSFDNRYLNTAERYAIYQRATALARGDRTQAQILYARIASEALERVDGTYAQQHTGTDPWAINILNTIKVGRGTGGLFVATPAEYADTFLVEGAIVAGNEFRAIDKYGDGFTKTQLAAMEKAEAAKSINLSNVVTGGSKSLTVNLGVDALNLTTMVVDGYSQILTSSYNFFTDSDVRAFTIPKLEPLMPLTEGEAKSLLVLGIPGMVEAAPALVGLTLRVGTEVVTLPTQAYRSYQLEKVAAQAEAAEIAKARIDNNFFAEASGFGVSAQREFVPGESFSAERINAGQVTDRDGLPRVDVEKAINDALVAENLSLPKAPYYAAQRPAWMEGTSVLDRILDEPELFRMVVDEAAAQRIRIALLNGDQVGAASELGAWATTDPINSVADVRNNLAISSEWKGANGAPIYILEFSAEAGVGVRQGVVGDMWDANAQVRLPGGGGQVNFLENTPREKPSLYSIDVNSIRRLK